MSSWDQPNASQQPSTFRQWGQKLGLLETPLFRVGEGIKLINPNTGELMAGQIKTIDRKTGQVEVRFENYPIPSFFASSESLLRDVEVAKQRERSMYDHRQLPKPRLAHSPYTELGRGYAEGEYAGRRRITSHTPSIQGKVYMPETLEDTMEAIVVDYEKDMQLRIYLESVIVPLVLHERISHGATELPEMLSLISKKIKMDFPYQQRMLDRQYAGQRYPPGQKVRLGAIMQNQDMICRHMGLLFAATVDFLRAHEASKVNEMFSGSEVRFMADIQRDLVENKEGGHAYCVVEKGGEYFLVDPTTGIAESAHDILSLEGSRRMNYRYLYSMLRYMLQNPKTEGQQFMLAIIRRQKYDPKIAEVLRDLKKTIGNDLLLARRFVYLERQQ